MPIKKYTAVNSTGIWQYRPNENDRTSAQFNFAIDGLGYDKWIHLLMQFAQPSGLDLFRQILACELSVYLTIKNDYTSRNNFSVLSASFDPVTVNYNNNPRFELLDTWSLPRGNFEGYKTVKLKNEKQFYNAIRNGAGYLGNSDDIVHLADTSRGQHPPFLSVTFSDDPVKFSISDIFPASGSRLDLKKSNVFSFSTIIDGNCLGTPLITNSVFHWRKAGTAEDFTINVPSGQNNLTVPANTFPSSALEFKFTASANTGQKLESNWSTFITSDTVSTAVAIQPDGGIVNADESVEFVWQHRNSSGAPQSSAELSLNKDDLGWENYRLPDSKEQRYLMPPGTIENGKYQWKVRTYNLDGVPGSWSNLKSFYALAKPTMPVIVSVDNSPRPLISWQSNGQSAFEIQIDNKKVISYYGSKSRWKSPDYLEDGSHQIKIRTQNQWGQWSDWAITHINTTNIPGPQLEISGIGGDDAELSWNDGGYDFYAVFRNGSCIGKTSALNYTDMFSISSTDYFVMGCYSDSSYYGKSNILNLNCTPEKAILSGPDGRWIPVDLSDDQYNSAKISYSRKIESRYLSGRDFPVSFPSPYRSKRIDLSFATMEDGFMEAMELLAGELVCIKLPSGIIIRGYLKELPCDIGPFFTKFRLSISQEYIPEVVTFD